MGLFNRKKKKEKTEEYVVPEERIHEIRENGVELEVRVGTHGNDELIAGSMLGSTGKLIAMSNYGNPIFKPTILYFLDNGIRIHYSGEFFDYQEIYKLEKRHVGLVHAEFAFMTTSGEILLKATNANFLAVMEIFKRDTVAYAKRLEQAEKLQVESEAQDKAESDVDRLIRLGELHERGLLSDEEFAEAKKKLL